MAKWIMIVETNEEGDKYLYDATCFHEFLGETLGVVGGEIVRVEKADIYTTIYGKKQYLIDADA